MRTAIGIDIGGTNVQLGLVNTGGELTCKEQFKVADVTDSLFFLNRLFAIITNFLQQSEHPISGIGIGSPGANIKTGHIEKASNLPWNNLSIVPALCTKFGMPVYLTNDANLFAIGEKHYGKAGDLNDFAVLTLGTGVGGGFYSSGTLLQGRDGLAGEVGHVTVERDGRMCACGRKGCLERYVSASGVVVTTNELILGSHIPSILRTEEKLTAELVANAAINGDELAGRVFELTGEVLGRALADLVAYLNPEAIFLAGGLAKAGDLLFLPTVRSFKQSLLDIYPSEILITSSSIHEDHAGVMGAAALVWDANTYFKQIKSPITEL